MKHLFTLLFIVTSFAIYAQEAKLKIRYIPNPLYVSYLDKNPIEVHLSYLDTTSPYTREWTNFRTYILQPGVTELFIDSLPPIEMLVEFQMSEEAYRNVKHEGSWLRVGEPGIKVSLRLYLMTSIEKVFPRECIYDWQIGKICPKCKKEDRVLPIVYGLPRVDPLTDKLVKPFDQPHYPGGCEVTDCNPSWYCERDRIEF